MKLEQKSSLKTLDLCYIALFSALMAIFAWISIPTAVPFTMQTFAIFAAPLILGGRRGTMAIIVYLSLGAVGLPVFSGFSGGLGKLLGSTGGYLLGYLPIGILYWGAESWIKKGKHRDIFILLIGLIVCYVLGTLWFIQVYAANTGEIDLKTALAWCVTPFILPDLVKLGLAKVLATRIAPFVK